jgi:hypothetical protein
VVEPLVPRHAEDGLDPTPPPAGGDRHPPGHPPQWVGYPAEGRG